MNLIKLITKSLISICINLIIYIISSFIPKSKKYGYSEVGLGEGLRTILDISTCTVINLKKS